MKALLPTNQHDQKLWPRLVFEKKGQTQRSEGQGYGIKWKIMPKEIHMWNMKALAPTNQKL
jgi:hypothetical protein